jgi:acyl dehydratase
MTVLATSIYQVQAYNTSKSSENKIHDDTVARRFGFAGGLVPGVDVYGYMAHMPLARWGSAWLSHGTADCRLLKPVYDGETATVTARETPLGLSLDVTSRGELCATGTATLADPAPPGPAIDSFAHPPPPPAHRPPADELSLAVGTLLGMAPVRVTLDAAAAYLCDVHETDPLYAREGLVHAATILRAGNWVLRDNVELGPWMHVGSSVRHFGFARTGDTLTARGRVTANYEHKGHRFVEVALLVLANGATAVAHIAHTAIYRPRQVAAV